jgi:hypothetical protein
LQGYKIYLSSLKSTSDVDLYAQWQKATVVYAIGIKENEEITEITDEKLKALNSSAYNPFLNLYDENDKTTWYFTENNVVYLITGNKESIQTLFGKLSENGTINTNYIVIIDHATMSFGTSSSYYTDYNKTTTLPNYATTITGKYNGIVYLDTSSTSEDSDYFNWGELTLSNNIRFRNIRTRNGSTAYTVTARNTQYIGKISSNIYAAGWNVYIDYGVVSDESYLYKSGNKVSNYSAGTGCISLYSKYKSTSDAPIKSGNQECIVLSGHWVRLCLDRGSDEKTLKTIPQKFKFTIGGNANIDFLVAGGTETTIAGVDVTLEVRDNAHVTGIYGGHHGYGDTTNSKYNGSSYFGGTVHINIEGNANIKEIFGTGGGRYLSSSPYFKGDSYINVMSGNVENIYGGPAAGRVRAKTDGTASEIHINIKGGTIGNVYGGGYGYQYDPFYPLTYVHKDSGSVEGNIYITTENATIGNIYGSGKGFNFYYDINGDGVEEDLRTTDLVGGVGTKFILSLAETGNAYHQGDTTITLNSGTVITGSVYGAGEGYSDEDNASTARKESGTTEIIINSGALVNGNVYGGGDNSYVLNNTSKDSVINITLNGGTVSGNIFGGGNLGSVTGNIGIKANSGTLAEIFGGGYSGIVTGNTNIEIASGEYENVFGGCDQSYITGDSKITVGNTADEGVTISGIVYGGGRGVVEEGKTDASDYSTVKGTSEVIIQGINTQVENYGSTKLGKVDGDANIDFINYWSGNPTSKYKIMNGIDRATTVSFENSYVLLTNEDEDGNLVGISDIENLVIPDGSGLKISADGKISGNFSGGGELYLDSRVCLTVEKNITGTTTLVLNPEIVEAGNEIAGGIESPYLKVGGDSEATDKQANATRLVSGESKKYTILVKNYTDNYAHYYIKEDILITNYINDTLVNSEGKIYNGTIASSNKNIYILNNESFSSSVKIEYVFLDTEETQDKYRNITKELVLKNEKNEAVAIPKGTEIVMINDGKYYKYIVSSSDENAISFGNFVKFEEDTNYPNVFDLTTTTPQSSNEVAETKTYNYQENFRFVVDLSNGESRLDDGAYYVSVNIKDNGQSIGEEQNESTNMIDVVSRDYSYSNEMTENVFENDENISVSGKLTIGKLNEKMTGLKGKSLSAKIKLIDSNGKLQSLEGNTVTVNSTKYECQSDMLAVTLLENISNSETVQNIDIEFDMLNVLPQYRLSAGEYQIVVDVVLSENNVLEDTVQTEIKIPIVITENDTDSFGLDAKIKSDESQMADEIELINKGISTEKTISLAYNGNFENPKVKIKVLEKTGEFEYAQTDNSKKIKIKVDGVETDEITKLSDTNEVTVNFADSVEEGTYKIVFELYCDQDVKKTESIVNFIVYE